jgi:hypothetical protein
MFDTHWFFAMQTAIPPPPPLRALCHANLLRTGCGPAAAAADLTENPLETHHCAH